MRILIASALVWLAAGPATALAQTRALRFAAVVDGTGRVIPNGVVVVDGDKIARVLTARDPVPANAQTLDLTRYTAIPGMIDVHTHMTYYWDPTSGTDPWRQPPRQPEQTVQLAKANALKTLEAGVTTVRDLGASNYSDIALRDSINKAGWIGPRMFVAGYGLQRAHPPY
jgi:imidazolonepropionase-like amidohydrolase